MMEKVAKKAYVEFCDGKYHWAVLSELRIFDVQNKLIYKWEKDGPTWKYEYSGHRDIAYYDSSVGRVTTTKIYSDDYRIIYESEEDSCEIREETWYEYNEQNKLIKKKIVGMCDSQPYFWTYVDYQYNKDGVLEKIVETVKDLKKKTESIEKEKFFNERGLLIREIEINEEYGDFVNLYEYDEADNLVSDTLINLGSIKTTYKYDDSNNMICRKHYDGSEDFYKTISEKKGNLTIKKVYMYKAPSTKTAEKKS